ncbi:hypothetical protein SCHPADRAFT_643782 [Schizopora paradoxa]|uniref:Uncharacterized protein n=1 Tax=Schizopora paradoxa TaxID=27342 RepID=A0A0H2R6V0_9AGAM|nr:hypothetical protein SCHPADRAFT_643782 [Schizopora paradoxa]
MNEESTNARYMLGKPYASTPRKRSPKAQSWAFLKTMKQYVRTVSKQAFIKTLRRVQVRAWLIQVHSGCCDLWLEGDAERDLLVD